MNRFLLLLLLLASAGRAGAQSAASTDVILRTDGTEVPGRVVTITPLELRYLPPASADTVRLASADTVRLASADVFLVRYANGTREVMHPLGPAPITAPGPLADLSEAQRRTLAQRDADHGYTGRSPFWGTFAASVYGGPLLGWIAPVVIAPKPVAARNLGAPHPERLADPVYNQAYLHEVQRRKRHQTWAGYGTGMAVWVLLVGTLAASNP